jgi:hypothetical protein
MFDFTAVVFDGNSPPLIPQTLQDGTAQVQLNSTVLVKGYQVKMQNAAFRLTDSGIKSINQTICVGGTFCDLAKTSDCANHEILLAKLHFYRPGGIGLSKDWFYLSNRRQNVEIKPPNTTKTASSLCGTLKHGVHQG